MPAALVLVMLVSLALPQGRRVAGRGWKFTRRAAMIVTGHLVAVGDHRLYVSCSGSGSPTVIMDSGLNMTIDSWGTVPSSVAQFTRVCIYDRAGLGESDRGPTPKTTQQVADELHLLLRNRGISGPYVVVGHSVGGLNVRLFASEHPDEITGMVLIDPSHEDEYARIAALMPPEMKEKFLRHEGGGNHEKLNLLTGAEQVKRSAPIPPIPLCVLVATTNEFEPEQAALMDSLMSVHIELRSKLSQLSPKGKLIMVKDSGHFIQQEQPHAVIDAIRSVVEAAREQR